MVNKKKALKRKRKPGFKQVDFFAGIKTPSKKDDRRVRFTARKLGKDSPLPRPKRAKALRRLSFTEGFDTRPPKPKKKDLLPVGLAEASGLSFDDAFKLGNVKKKNPFKSNIGIDINFGKRGEFNADFSKAFREQEFDFSRFPTMIEADFDDDPDIEGNIEDSARDDVPSLLESLPTIQQRQPRRLEDDDLDDLDEEEEEEMSKADRIDSKFIRVRQEALETGANPLTPEEERNFEAGIKQSRNFGTTARGPPRRNVGVGLGRF